MLAAAGAACLVASPVVQAAGSLSDYRLLVMDGRGAKWGSPVLGTGATLTYAVATATVHTPAAINCGDLGPLDRILAANRMKRADFDAELTAAFAAWSAAANVTFVPVDDAASADIVIGAEMVARGRAFTNVETDRPPAGIAPPVATKVMAASPASITRSLICLNPDQAWKIGFDGNLNVYDLRYALTHEIGHAIGLDHPDTPNALMDYRYTEAFTALQPGDAAGAAALYGTRVLVAKAASR